MGALAREGGRGRSVEEEEDKKEGGEKEGRRRGKGRQGNGRLEKE